MCLSAHQGPRELTNHWKDVKIYQNSKNTQIHIFDLTKKIPTYSYLIILSRSDSSWLTIFQLRLPSSLATHSFLTSPCSTCLLLPLFFGVLRLHYTFRLWLGLRLGCQWLRSNTRSAVPAARRTLDFFSIHHLSRRTLQITFPNKQWVASDRRPCLIVNHRDGQF